MVQLLVEIRIVPTCGRHCTSVVVHIGHCTTNPQSVIISGKLMKLFIISSIHLQMILMHENEESIECK